ncbi:VIT domain-containing protein [Caulobacter endophyticus]|uniref:VIT domain-containing protein n=1 Tax=Caulobacter endophyticus TaxID=2172652 RepID=A0A2T9K2C6_9CAUL|nr:VIT domain-containing protein [Caulobacter endophyticus]PVM90115.1 hypothetical protein DDF67_10935 [Caulobacter endophyticus]
MRFAWIVLVAALAAGGASVAAPAANPSLKSIIHDGGDPDARPDVMRLAALKIEVVIVGGLARTQVEARFANPTDQEVEADFTLALPAGAVVDGYALDIDEVMVDGVLTGKRQAREVYEDRVRAGIDPGLAEVTEDGGFHTQVYPVPRNGERTIRLSYAAPLAADGGFALPLVAGEPVGEVQVKVTVLGAQARPVVSAPGGLVLAWTQGADGDVATGSARDVRLDGALSVGAWRPASPLELSRRADGERFFELILPYDARAASVRALRIYWDRSRSRRDDDLAGEIALLSRYVDAVRPASVELVTFASDAPTVQALAAPTGEALAAALAAVRYGGASTLGPALAAGKTAADTCVFVSDGRMTLGSWAARPPACRVFALSSAGDADRNFLSTLAARGGGQHVDLAAIDAGAGLARLTSAGAPPFKLTAGGRPADYRLIAGPAGRWHILGKAPRTGRLVFTGPDGVRRAFALADLPVRNFPGAGAIWGRETIAELLATDRPDRDQALALARRYNVASGEASFVVMEDAYDYVQAGVAPPPSAGEEIAADYREALAEQTAEKASFAADRLETMIEAWNEQKRWWRSKPGEDFDGEARGGYGGGGGFGGEGLDEIVVTGVRHEPTIAIQTAEWNPDRPYLKALAAAPSPAAWAERFAALEASDGQAPAFYFDVAEQSFRAGRRDQAVAVALNALELPSAGVKTLSVLADRMTRYGEFDHAVWLYERILFLDIDRPQPRRDLALALIARGEARKGRAREADWRRALDLLNAVIVTPWSDAYDGVELVALMEANGLVARMAALGMEQNVLDRRLTARLDVDLRVVMEWNTDKSDMDLWVDEPTGERAMYSNAATDIGGRLSNDMTSGYGPEEYLLRRAPSGDYVVTGDVFAPDRLDPNGPTVVRVRLYRNWGRRNQAEERFEIELQAGQTDEAVLGRFKVDRGR